MASIFLRPTLQTLSRPVVIATLGVSTSLLVPNLLHSYRNTHSLRLDSSPSSPTFSTYQSTASTPIITQGGSLNAKAVRQLSFGSITGLIAGLGISVFSKPLAVLFGLLIVGVQTLESYGLHIVPRKRLQRLFSDGVDIRGLVQDNVAFKISFGLMFALSGFAEF